MKLYCKIENDVVVQGPTTLPLEYANMSDFELLELGWYVAVRQLPETFNDRLEIMLPVVYDIQPTKVVCTFIKREKTQEELDTQNLEKQNQVNIDKLERLSIVQEFIQSDQFTQLTEENKIKWLEYKMTIENTATTNLGNEIWNVAFPSQPLTSNDQMVLWNIN